MLSKKYVLQSMELWWQPTNCPGQLVISGASAVEKACEAMKAAGAKRALLTCRWSISFAYDGACKRRARSSY
jgi:hypothetical protein